MHQRCFGFLFLRPQTFVIERFNSITLCFTPIHFVVMKNMLRISLAVVMVLCSFAFASAQVRTITGKVTDAATKKALGGVKVTVKGSNRGSFAKADGTYAIAAPTDAKTLVFEYIGFKKKEVAISSENLDVALAEDVMLLEELVVTAVGIKQEKKAISYAMQEVKGDVLEQGRQPNVVNALAGQIAGVQVSSSSGSPGGSSYIKIRGTSSITGNNQPLFVIDGIPMSNDAGNGAYGSGGVNSVDFGNRAMDLNPDDIESINVLKGAAATTLYGLLASPGAIVITTKKGKEGSQASINYSYSLGYEQVNKLPELQTTYSQGANGNLALPNSGTSTSWGARIDTLIWTKTDYPWDKNGSIVGASQKALYPNSIPVTPYDRYKFYQTGITQQHNLNISGGSNVATYFASASLLSSKGVVPNSAYNKGTFRVNATYNMFDDFSVAANIQYTGSDATRIERGSNTSGVTLGLFRTPATFDNSNGLSDPTDPNTYKFPAGASFNGASIAGRQRSYRGFGTYDNPYWVVNQQPLTEQVSRLTGSLELKYTKADWFLKDILGDLSITYRLGEDFTTTKIDQHFAIGAASFPTGRVVADRESASILNSDLILSLDKRITEDFRAKLILGNNLYQRIDNYIFSRGDGLLIPDYYHLSNVAPYSVFQYDGILRRGSLFAKLGFEFKDMLYVNGSLRNDWSTSLPEKNNSFMYGGVDVGFIFSEAFFKDNEILPYGKLRASYAQSGSDAPIYNLTTPFVRASVADGYTNGVTFPFNGTTSFKKGTTLGSDQLRPESKTEIELGLELKFFQNRFGLDVTVYQTTNKDQILPVPIATSTGYDTRVVNAGTMETKGIEVALNSTIVRAEAPGDFQFDLSVNFSALSNLVKELAPGVDNIFLGGFNGGSLRAVAGKPYGSIYGLGWLRNAQGQLIIDADGLPQTNAAESAWGSATPDFIMGIRPKLSWQGLSITALLDIKQGGFMWNGTRGALNYFGTGIETAARANLNGTYDGVTFINNVAQGVTADGKPNTTVIFKRPNGNYGQSFWGTDGYNNNFNSGMGESLSESTSWIRLREITVSYRLPKVVTEPLAIVKNIEVFFTGRNLWLSTSYRGVDPESSLLGANNAQGLDYFNNPGTKSYTFGLRVGF